MLSTLGILQPVLPAEGRGEAGKPGRAKGDLLSVRTQPVLRFVPLAAAGCMDRDSLTVRAGEVGVGQRAGAGRAGIGDAGWVVDLDKQIVVERTRESSDTASG